MKQDWTSSYLISYQKNAKRPTEFTFTFGIQSSNKSAESRD
jgi:hypothetical protein